MRNLIILACLLLLLVFTPMVHAQINAPAPSPMCKVEQKIGVATFQFEFSRPSQKGRELFVDVEKWGKIWRTGANASTKIGFDRDVTINGHKVEKGNYALYTIPNKSEWTVMLYDDLSLGGNVDNYNEDHEVLRFNAKPRINSQPVETFFIMTDHITTNSAQVQLMWGKYIVPFTVMVDTDTEVLESIERTLSGPTARDYYTAANYYRNNGKDKKQALAWIKKANDMDPRFWMVRLQAELEHELGDTSAALRSAKKAVNMAQEGGYDVYAEEIKAMAARWK